MNERRPESIPLIETEKPKKVFLEVGISTNYHGSGPLILSEAFQRNPNEIYIGLDYDRNALEATKARLTNQQQSSGNLFLIEADAQQVPLVDKSVDTVYFGNVFGGVHDNPLVRKEDGIRKKFIKEAHRVLKDDGRLIVFENITPENADDWREEEERGIEPRLIEGGFEIKSKIEETNPIYSQIISEIGIIDQRQAAPGTGKKFLLVAKPKVEQIGEKI